MDRFKNGASKYRSKGKPEKVLVHDFMDKQLGEPVPYGVYDIGNNMGWVSIGLDHDTACFSVETIRRWWYYMGRESHPEAKKLLITADSGGSEGSRVRLWKVELQKARAGSRNGAFSVPLASRLQQMEQNRASPLRFHHAKLVRKTPHKPSSHCQSDRGHNLPHWAQG